MKPETARYVIERLEKDKGRKFGNEGLSKIKPDLLKEPDAAMMAAGDYIILNMASLPSAAKLLEIVQQEGKKIRMQEARDREDAWKKEKGENAEGRVEGSTFLSKQQRDEYAKRGLMMVQLAITLGPCQDMIDGCLAMAAAYPHMSEEWRETRLAIVEQVNRQKAIAEEAA